MRPAGLVDHGGAERGGVVRAEEPPGLVVVERDVEQVLVALAFDELVGPAVRRDRLADAAHPATTLPVVRDERRATRG